MDKIISGKVRDVYVCNDQELVIVTTDRISAFDVILPSLVPGKGIALNQLSLYWFAYTQKIVPNHILSTQLSDLPAIFSQDPVQYAQRTVLAKKLHMLPYEFIVRGYLFGSLWQEYQSTGCFCGKKVKGFYALAQRLDKPILTPSIKMDHGHDQPISLEQLKKDLGAEEADRICKLCLTLYQAGYAHAASKGILIADTKFEFGYDEKGNLVLADELFTPDSSRFWAGTDWQAGKTPRSYDKQFVRDWLIANRLNGVSPAPELPEAIIQRTAALYRECYAKITGNTL